MQSEWEISLKFLENFKVYNYPKTFSIGCVLGNANLVTLIDQRFHVSVAFQHCVLRVKPWQHRQESFQKGQADKNITSLPMWKGSRFPHCLLSLSCLYVFTAYWSWEGIFHGILCATTLWYFQSPSVNLVVHTQQSADAVELRSTFHSKRAVYYFEVKAGRLINIWSK